MFVYLDVVFDCLYFVKCISLHKVQPVKHYYQENNKKESQPSKNLLASWSPISSNRRNQAGSSHWNPDKIYRHDQGCDEEYGNTAQ